MSKGKLDVIIWAHSDQTGGTEMACVIAAAMRKVAGPQFKCGIVTPFPQEVKSFFSFERGYIQGISTIKSQKLLRFEKDSGKVSVPKTRQVLQDLAESEAEKILRDGINLVKDRIHNKTLFISCGEPLALGVAQKLERDRIIVTDHLLTQSIDSLMKNGGITLTPKEKNLLSEMISWETNDPWDIAAYLAAREFGIPRYWDYLANDCRKIKTQEMHGCMYDPIPEAELLNAPHYDELEKLNSIKPVVIVFPGGGNVWDEIILNLHNEVRSGKLQDFAIILRDIDTQTKKPIARTWRLFAPANDETRKILSITQEGTQYLEKRLKDPGRMMYWYAACTVIVGRGGLAAQQTFATNTSKTVEGAPILYFIQEPDHEQIESERTRLNKMGLIRTEKLDEFRRDPFTKIEKIIEDEKGRVEIRAEIDSIYDKNRSQITCLAERILAKYKPHRRESNPNQTIDPEKPFNYFQAFIEDKSFDLEDPDLLSGQPWPDQLEIHLPPDNNTEKCKMQCRHCYGSELTISTEGYGLTEEAAIGVIKDLKGKTSRIVISGLATDPLNSKMLPVILKEARAGIPQNIGVHTKLIQLDDNIITALFKDCLDGDYLTVSLDAGTVATYEKITNSNEFSNVLKNLDSLKVPRQTSGGLLRLNLNYLLTTDNLYEKDILKAYDLALKVKADMIRFSVMQAKVTSKKDLNPIKKSKEDNLKKAIETINSLVNRKNDDIVVKLMEFRDWSNEGFKFCRTQLFHPTLGTDGYLYPCCQVAWGTHEVFEKLRIGEAIKYKGDFEKRWRGEDRKKLIQMEVGDRLGNTDNHMNCRVCNRKDGNINAGLAAWLVK